jgi:hypothetical protein
MSRRTRTLAVLLALVGITVANHGFGMRLADATGSFKTELGGIPGVRGHGYPGTFKQLNEATGKLTSWPHPPAATEQSVVPFLHIKPITPPNLSVRSTNYPGNGWNCTVNAKDPYLADYGGAIVTPAEQYCFGNVGSTELWVGLYWFDSMRCEGPSDDPYCWPMVDSMINDPSADGDNPITLNPAFGCPPQSPDAVPPGTTITYKVIAVGYSSDPNNGDVYGAQDESDHIDITC